MSAFDVCVVGLGEVGLPLALAFAREGVSCAGVERDARRRASLLSGELASGEPGVREALAEALSSGAFRLLDTLPDARAYLFATSPAGPEQLAALTRAALEASSAPGVLLVVESTCGPGWVREGVVDVAARTHTLGVDVHVAHAPERVTPGRALDDLATLDRIVGADTAECARRARDLYALICSGRIHECDIETAGLVKLFENASRAVEVALADELADIAATHGVDALRALELANMHPRVSLLRPGLGAWGRCLPLATELLAGTPTPLVQAARAASATRPERAARRVALALEHVDGACVGVLGLSYKPGSSDTRMAPAEVMVRWWKRHAPGLEILAHDPFVSSWEHAPLVDLDALRGRCDALVIAMAHDPFVGARLNELVADERVRWLFDFQGVLRQQAWSNEQCEYVGPGFASEDS